MNSDQRSVDAREEHPEVDEISALTEGVLPADRTEDVLAHLADCSLCTEVKDSLDEIRGLLGRLPGTVQMPADVAGRIDAALAAETLLSSTSSSDDTHETDGRETLSGPDRPVSGGPVGTPVPVAPSATGSTRHTVSTGPARGARSGPGRSGRPRRRWPVGVLGAACGAAVLGFGVFFVSTLEGSGGLSDSADSGASAEKHTSAAQQYTDDTIAPMVRDLLTRTADNPGLDASEDQDEGTRSPLVAPGEDRAPTRAGKPLPGCVLDATERPSETPLATDVGEYRGKPVGVVVLPDHGDSKLVNVFLVDSSCATISPSDPGTVLLKRSVPRS